MLKQDPGILLEDVDVQRFQQRNLAAGLGKFSGQSAIRDNMLSQIAKEVVESSHISSSGEQYPGNVFEHVETQRSLDYILTASRHVGLFWILS